MKITMRAHTAAGSVFKGQTETYTAQSVEDRGDYYAVIIHANREVRFTKKYWEMVA